MSDENDFIPIFKAEVEETLTALNSGVVHLEKQPDQPELVKELNRQAHNVKGSARVFGFLEIEKLNAVS